MIDPTSRSARRLWGFGDLGGAGHAHGRWPVECRAGGVEWWPVHRRIACPAGPSGVSADVAEAGLMADEDLVRAERVSVGASAGWLGDPLPPACSDELTLHGDESIGHCDAVVTAMAA